MKSKKNQKAVFTYKAAQGAPYTDADVQKVVPTILALEREHGGAFRPKHVLEAARNPRSPLYGLFEWNDRKAAEKYRLVQARRLIKAVRYVIQVGQVEFAVPVFHRIFNDGTQLPEADKGHSYVTLATAGEVVDFQNQILADALRDLRFFKARYEKLSSSFTEFKTVLEAIVRFERVIEKKQKRKAA